MTTATATGPNYSVDSQIGFIVQWFRTWSELQKDDFVEVLAQKLTPGSNVNGLVNGMQKLETDSRRVSLFSCQMKLFKEWWDTWSESEKDNLTSRLKDSDSKFWTTVQEELSGTRKKLEDDFFITINTCITSSETADTDDTADTNISGVEVVVTTTNGDHEEEDDNNVISINGEIPTVNGHQEKDEEMEDVDDADGVEHSG